MSVAVGKELFYEVAKKEMLHKTTRQRIDSQDNTRKESKKRKLLQSWKRAVVVSSKVQRPITYQKNYLSVPLRDKEGVHNRSDIDGNIVLRLVNGLPRG